MIDYSTLNEEALAKLPVLKLAPTYRVDSEAQMGSGCFGDPPGFPSYFLRSVWTKYGNYPRRGPRQFISTPATGPRVVFSSSEPYHDNEAREAYLRSLWNPLPLEHPRTQAWIRAQFSHFHSCYADPERPEYGKPGTLIFPLPGWRIIRCGTKRNYVINPTWPDSLVEAHKRKVDTHNAAVDAAIEAEQAWAASLATPDNHQATRIIRRYYPEFEPTPELIETKLGHQGEWWVVMAERPTPETCKPLHGAMVGHQHQTNETWCQWCGRLDDV